MGCGSSKSVEDTDAPELDEFPVSATEPGYPPPKPPKNKKEDCFNAADFVNIDNKSKVVAESKLISYDALIGELTNGLTTDLEKLRAIYIWLGNQNIEHRNYVNITDNSTPLGYMKNIKHGKGSFTSFFTLLCRAAKLPCVILYGKGKSKNYEVGDSDFTDLNSQWTAVYVDGSWRIVHALWSFRAVSGFSKGTWTQIEKDGQAGFSKEARSSGKNISRIYEYYFLTNPDEFIFKCRPDNDPWQLLQTPWSMNKYINVPYCHPAFFQSGLKIVSQNNSILKSEKGKCWIEFEHLDTLDPEMNYKLFYNEEASRSALPTDRPLNLYVAYSNELTKKGYVVRFPAVGVYRIVISDFCEFRLDCPEVGEIVNEFPVNPEIGYGYGRTAASMGIHKITQTYGFLHLEINEKKTINFNVQNSSNVYSTFFGGVDFKEDFSEHIHQDVKDNQVTLEVNMPPDKAGDYLLQVTDDQQVLMNYLVTSDNIVKTESTSSSPRRDPVRESLIRATNGSDIEQLEVAIEKFENDKLDDKGDLTRAKRKLQNLYDVRDKDLKNQHKEDRIRERIRLATSEDDIDELEAAIDEFMGNRLEDKGDLTAAKDKLLELYSNELRQAIDLRNVDRLEQVIERAKGCRVCGRLRYAEVMIEAEETLKQLQRLKKYIMKVLAMKQSTVSELASYKRPKPCIHDVMKATFLLLGEKEKQINRWEHVQSLLRKLGKQSVVRRIKEYDVINLKLPVANRSERLLTVYDKKFVCQSSAGAGTFFIWSRNIIDEIQDEDPRRRAPSL